MRRSSSTTLSTMNMTNWRSVAALVCSLKGLISKRISVSPSVKEEDRTKARTLASSFVVNGGDGGEENLSCMSTPCDMQSFIVWMMAGIAERETARKAMRRWREPRAIATTLAFFVAPPMRGFCMAAICRDKVRLGYNKVWEVIWLRLPNGVLVFKWYAYVVQAHLPYFPSFL